MGHLFRPKWVGPFPSVVLLHTCNGLSENNFDWANMLVNEGYIALVVDTFGSRGLGNSCGQNLFFEAAKDAYGARDYIKTLPFADKKAHWCYGLVYGRNCHIRGLNLS